MTNRPGQALAQALALFRAPRGARPGPDERLPEGMFLLLRLVAGEEQALSTAREQFVEPPEHLREAAAFYVQQVLFSPQADSYRVLGVDPDASDEKIREHFRWMARWLHPDRNQDEWEAFYADRVNQAWNSLRTPEKRQRYDSERREIEQVHGIEPTMPERMPIRMRHQAEPEPVANGMNLRWVPTAVLGSLAVLALLGVIAFSLLRYAESSRPMASAADPGEQPQVPAALSDLEAGMSAPAASIPASVDSGPLASAPAATPPPPTVAPPAPVEPTPAPAPPPIAAAPVRPAPTAIPARERGRVPALASADPVARPMKVAVVLPPEAEEHSPAQPAASPERAATIAQVAAAPAPASVSPPAGISDRTANQILGSFSRAYSDGDLSGMRTMFTHDATGTGGNLASIMDKYSHVFGSSSDRSLDVSNVSWWTSGATLTIVASYEASVLASPNATPRRTHGDLRLDLRKQGDQWKIFRLRHDERPG